jgi:hypothetical protein
VTCTETITLTVYFPPSELLAAMAKPKYLYMEDAATELMHPDPAVSFSAPRRVADNAYTITVTRHAQVGIPAIVGFCTVLTESADGLGLPGQAACGQPSIAATDVSVWGGNVPFPA